MLRFKMRHLFLLPGLIAPICASAHYCIKVNGGFGNGGTSYIGRNFVVPAAGDCKRWAGFTKTAATVVLISTGTGCLSTNGKVLTFTIFSTDPEFLGPGVSASDHIQYCRAGVTPCPIGAGQDQGTFGGSAAPQVCTTALLTLPAIHD